jgi:hypothetical protein
LGVCVLYVLLWHLMGLARRRAARLKSQSAKWTACYRIGAIICSLPRASLRSGARFDLLFGLSAARLCQLELGASPQHGVHDDGETPRQRDAAALRQSAPHRPPHRRNAPARDKAWSRDADADCRAVRNRRRRCAPSGTGMWKNWIGRATPALAALAIPTMIAMSLGWTQCSSAGLP